jgi:hypothetical protein
LTDKVSIAEARLMSFASSIFGGSNPYVSSGINQAGQTSTFANTKGQGLVNQAGGFFSDLMSGDMSKISKLLAPQIGAMTKGAQQQKKTMAEFGTRSGGMASKGATVDDTTRASINDSIAKLTGQAVSGGASMGQSLIDTGLKALNQQTDLSQQQLENWSNSILGQAMAKGSGAAMSFIPGMQ